MREFDNKPRRPKYSTLMVRFHTGNETDIWEVLDAMKLGGTCVSTFMNRWAIDVPFGKEAEFKQKLSLHEIVMQVN